MTPDPVARLAQFTPAAVDTAELLFAAGRASARTPWYCKAGVAVSLLANATCGWMLLSRPPAPQAASPPAESTPPAVVVPPAAGPDAPATPAPEPWSYQAFRSQTDPERLPAAVFVSDGLSDGKPLTVLSGRSGEID